MTTEEAITALGPPEVNSNGRAMYVIYNKGYGEPRDLPTIRSYSRHVFCSSLCEYGLARHVKGDPRNHLVSQVSPIALRVFTDSNVPEVIETLKGIYQLSQ
jgi:hypothetical protein